MPALRLPSAWPVLFLALGLAACGSAADEGDPVDRDPVSNFALELPLMTDPDLTLSNPANELVAPGGPDDRALPPVIWSDGDAAQAQADAQVLTGGRRRLADYAEPPSAHLAAKAAGGLSATAAALMGMPACKAAAVADFSVAANFGTVLKGLFPIYPRGHLLEAAQAVQPACRLLAARFVTPVPVDEIIAFYHARARSADWRDRTSRDADASLIEGAGPGAARFAVLARPAGPDGTTLVDLVLRGVE